MPSTDPVSSFFWQNDFPPNLLEVVFDSVHIQALKNCLAKFHLPFLSKYFDRDRTRTCNPQIRSLVPYPLGQGHTVLCRLPTNFKNQNHAPS